MNVSIHVNIKKHVFLTLLTSINRDEKDVTSRNIVYMFREVSYIMCAS